MSEHDTQTFSQRYPPVGNRTIGQRIRQARLAAGLTQVELAAKLGMRQHNLSAIECGRNTPFDRPLRLLRIVAKATGLSLQELVE